MTRCQGCNEPIVEVFAGINPRHVEHEFTAQCGHVVPPSQARDLWRAGLRWTLPRIDGVSLTAAERARQIVQEGHTPADDAEYESNALAWAAWSYLDRAANPADSDEPPAMWPWDKAAWKPDKTPLRQLIIASALIAAEIDRRLLAERAKHEGN